MTRTKNSKDIGKRSKRHPHSTATKAKISASKKRNIQARSASIVEKNHNMFFRSLHAQENEGNTPSGEDANNTGAGIVENDVAEPVTLSDIDRSATDGYFYETWTDEVDPAPPTTTGLDQDEESSAPTQKPKFMDPYIHAIQKRLKIECSNTKAAEIDTNWLVDHLKENDWRIRSCHSKWICKKLELEFDPRPYYKDVFIWLPDIRWGLEAMPCCPTCLSNAKVHPKGFRYDILGRRVIGMRNSYFAVTRRYKCQKCEITSDGNDGQYTFMGWNYTSLMMLPHGYQYHFPAFMTRKCAFDYDILRLLRPLFDKGLRPSAMEKMLLELHSIEYTVERIKYNYEVNRKIAFCKKYGSANPNFQPVSDFGERLGYNGLVPDRRYIVAVYHAYHATIKDYLDIELKKRIAHWLAIDFSYKVGKHLWQYHGHRLFAGLCTALNEIGECRIQFQAVTEEQEQMTSPLLAFKETAERYGQPQLELLFEDNPKSGKDFFQRVFPSLLQKENEFNQGVGAKECAIATATNFEISMHKGSASLSRVFDALQAHITAREEPGAPFIVGFDLEWKVKKNERQRIVGKGRVATMQLAYKMDEMRIANVLQLKSLKTLPIAFDQLVKLCNVIFVGVNIVNDMENLRNDFSINDETFKEIRTVNLGLFARKRGVVSSGTVGMQELVATVLREHLPKDPVIRFSNWESNTLTDEQINYAALDAIKGIELYEELNKKKDLTIRLNSDTAKANLMVDIVPSHGSCNVTCLATRAGIGRILGETSCVNSLLNARPALLKSLKLSRIVEIREVFAPNFFIPNMKMKNGEKVTLGDYGEPPFITRLNVTMLWEHVEDETIQPTPGIGQIDCSLTQPAPRNAVGSRRVRTEVGKEPNFGGGSGESEDSILSEDQSEKVDSDSDGDEDLFNATDNISSFDDECNRVGKSLHMNEIHLLIDIVKRGVFGGSEARLVCKLG